MKPEIPLLPRIMIMRDIASTIGMTVTEKNLRGSARMRSLKGAKILLNNRNSSIDCVVRNISETGAKIVFATPMLVPDSFSIRFEDGRERPCIVRWRAMMEMGIEFQDEARARL